jgi:hypothetical protein
MTDEELIRFGKEVRRLAENPFQRYCSESGCCISLVAAAPVTPVSVPNDFEDSLAGKLQNRLFFTTCFGICAGPRSICAITTGRSTTEG